MENQITQPKKKHKVLKVLLICIGVFIFLLVIAYFTIPHILRQKYLEECNSVTAEEMGSIKVTSNESNAFVYWPIIRGSTWSGYILPEEDRTVYTNAKEIEITIPYEVSGEYDENNVTDFSITAQKGKIISYNRSSGEMVFSQCGAVNVSMYIKYQP